MKKLLIFIPDFRGGGAEKVTVNLCNEFIQHYNVEVAVMNTHGVMQKKLNKKIIIHNLNIKRIRSLFFKMPYLIKKTKPNYIIAQMWPLTSILILLKFLFFLKPKIFICEHVNLYESIKYETSFNFYIAFPIIFLTHNMANKLIVVSEGVKKQFNHKFMIAKRNIEVIYNPVIDDAFKNYPVSKTLYWKKPSSLKLLSVGRLKKQKNFSYLIETLSLIKDLKYELLIVGDGEEYNKLSKLIKNLNLEDNIKLIGYKEDLNNYYFNADIFILSSLWEGFGNVIVEALYYNTIVVSTDCDYGPKEILDGNKYGILAPLNNKNKFAEIITEAINFKNKNIKERTKIFETKEITKKYYKVFENAE